MTVGRKLKDFGLVTQGLILMSGMVLAYLLFYLKTLLTRKILYSESELQSELKTLNAALGSLPSSFAQVMMANTNLTTYLFWQLALA